MYSQSVPALISKNVGNTLTNYKSWGGILYSLLSYGAKGDGVTDDSASIQSALNAASTDGVKIVDGLGKTYLIKSSITIPAGITLQNLTLQAGTAGMNMILVNNKSKVYGTIIGTGTTNIVERGIYPAADGVSDVKLDVEVSNLTFGIHAQPTSTLVPKRWNINAYVHDIVGLTGNSEGYGVVLSPAIGCNGSIKAVNIKRHALYLSAGAQHNDFYVDIDTVNNYGVQIYSTNSQTDSSYNRIRGSVRNLVNDSQNMSTGIAIVQNSHYNDISVNVVGGATAQQAFRIEGAQVTGVAYPTRNMIHNSKVSGQFLGTDVITVQNAESSVITDNDIAAYGTFSVIAFRQAGTITALTHAGFAEENRINAQGQNVFGIYTENITSPSYVGKNDIRNNGTSARVQDTTGGKRQGYSRSFQGSVSLSNVPANGGSASQAITFPEALANAIVTTSITGQGASNGNNTCHADGVGTSGFTLYGFNAYTAAQNLTANWMGVGD